MFLSHSLFCFLLSAFLTGLFYLIPVSFSPISGIASTVAVVTRLCGGHLRNLFSVFARSKGVISWCPWCAAIRMKGALLPLLHIPSWCTQGFNCYVTILISPLWKCSCCLHKLRLAQFCTTLCWHSCPDVFHILIYTVRFIMYSGITKICYRKTVGHVFTKPVQIERTTQNIFSQ